MGGLHFMFINQIVKTERLFSKGQKLLKRTKFSEAVETFNQALSINSKYARIYLHKAFALSYIKKHSEAVKSLEKAIELEPSNSVFPMFLGVVHLDHEKHEEASNALENSLHISPTNSLALSYKGLTLLYLRKIDEGYKLLKENIRSTNPDFQSRFMVYCEDFLLKKKELSKSLDEIIASEKKTSHLIQPIRLILKNMSNSIGQFIDKIDYLIPSIFLTILYIFRPQKRKAYVHYLEAEKHKSLNEIEPAIINYKKALELNPSLDEVRKCLTEVYITKNDFKNALKYAKSIKEDKRNKPQQLLLLGFIFYNLNKFEEAIEKINLAVEDITGNYEPFYYLGLCYLRIGNKDKARLSFKEATSRLNPQIAEKRLNEMIRIYNLSQEKNKNGH